MARRRRNNANTPNFVRVGIMGREARQFAVTSNMLIRDIISQLDVQAKEIKASVNGRTNFRTVADTDLVNGYSALLVIPAVSGGK